MAQWLRAVIPKYWYTGMALTREGIVACFKEHRCSIEQGASARRDLPVLTSQLEAIQAMEEEDGIIRQLVGQICWATGNLST